MIKIEFRNRQFRALYVKLPSEPATQLPQTQLFFDSVRLLDGGKQSMMVNVYATTSSEPAWQNINANLPDGLYKYRYNDGSVDIIGEHFTTEKVEVCIRRRRNSLSGKMCITASSSIRIENGDLRVKIRSRKGKETVTVPIMAHEGKVQFTVDDMCNFKIEANEPFSKIAKLIELS